MTRIPAKQRFRNIAKIIAIALIAASVLIWAGLIGTGLDKVAAYFVPLALIALTPPLVALYALGELLISLRQKKDPQRRLFVVLCAAMLVLTAAELIALTAYRHRQVALTPPIQENLFESLTYQAYEPVYVPNGYTLSNAHADSSLLGLTSSADDMVSLVYRKAEPDGSMSSIMLTQYHLDQGQQPPSPCGIENMTEKLHLYACDEVGRAGEFTVYKLALKEAYRGKPGYQEVSSRYAVAPNSWVQVEYLGAPVGSDELLRIISSLVPR